MHIPLMSTYSHQEQMVLSVHLSYPYVSRYPGNTPSTDCLSHCASSFLKSGGTIDNHGVGWFNAKRKLDLMSFPPSSSATVILLTPAITTSTTEHRFSSPGVQTRGLDSSHTDDCCDGEI